MEMFIIIGAIIWFFSLIFGDDTNQKKEKVAPKVDVPIPPILTEMGQMKNEESERLYRKMLDDLKKGVEVPPEVVAREARRNFGK